MIWRTVFKEDSLTTPVRVVVDGTCSGINDVLAKGENNIPMLVGIGLRSRLSRHVFTTDIKKMYNSLILVPQHYCYQLVLYNPGLASNCEPEWYMMLRGWYGLVSTGNQATTGVIKSAEASQIEYPLALPIVKEDTYVDDVKSGCNLREDVTTSIEHVQKALEKGGFMDKFILRNGDKPPEIASADGVKSASLGHWWFSESDQYGLKLDPFNPNKKIQGSRKPVAIVAQFGKM